MLCCIVLNPSNFICPDIAEARQIDGAVDNETSMFLVGTAVAGAIFIGCRLYICLQDTNSLHGTRPFDTPRLCSLYNNTSCTFFSDFVLLAVIAATRSKRHHDPNATFRDTQHQMSRLYSALDSFQD